MPEAQPYRITRQVPLTRIETFCHSLQEALARRYPSADLARYWRLYVSAECPVCGIRVYGEELRALAFAPCAELASAKGGRMRRGYCARSGCEAWNYSVDFWNQEGIDWPNLAEAAERAVQETGTSAKAPDREWFTGLGSFAKGHAARTAAVIGVVLGLWLARELYLGGRIPFLREPEQFRIESAPIDPTWPTPMEACDGPIR